MVMLSVSSQSFADAPALVRRASSFLGASHQVIPNRVLCWQQRECCGSTDLAIVAPDAS